MAVRYARLKKEWLLRGWSDASRSLINWKTGDEYRLGKDAFYVAESCDGRTDFASPIFMPAHTAFLDDLISEKIAEECLNGEVLGKFQEYRLAKNPRITGIHWAVTGSCNLHCLHCYMDAPSGRYRETSFADTALLIDQFMEANVTAVSLTGGEPFNRDDLFDVIRLLTSSNIRLTDIYSNGTLITDEKLEKLDAVGVRPTFRISFDGCGAHDRMRGTKGIEKLVVDTIRRIRKAGFPVAVTVSVDRMNRDCLPETYELMKALDVFALGIGRPQSVGCWRKTTSAISMDEMAECCEPLLRRWLDDGRPFRIGLEAFYSGDACRPPGRPDAPVQTSSTDNYVCASCREWPYVAPDGRLLPCIGYEQTGLVERMPNLLEKRLSDAWNDPFLRSLIDLKQSDVLARNEECAACTMLGSCGTGCRASALASGGDLLARDDMACMLWRNGYKRRFSEIAAAAPAPR